MTPILTWRVSGKSAPDSIVFRIVFVSPFFELEVRNGSQVWQPVYSQVAAPTSQEGSFEYPLLSFASYRDAELYATDRLKLTRYRPNLFMRVLNWVYTPPPASSMDGPNRQAYMTYGTENHPQQRPRLSVVHQTTSSAHG